MCAYIIQINLSILYFRKGDSQLVTFTKDGMTIKEIDAIISQTDFNGYPVVITKASQILYGYIWTRDIKKAFGNNIRFIY